MSTTPLPPILCALLDWRDEEIVVFGTRRDTLHVNLAARSSLPPTPMDDGAELRAHFVARGGEAVPLKVSEKVLGEMIVVRRPSARTWAEQEREAIREALQRTRGSRVDAARRLGISRTTLWRRMRAQR